jgi:hypothetical protein
LDYVKAVLPCDDADNNSLNCFFFCWTHGPERLQLTVPWEKIKITDPLVFDELQQPALGYCRDSSLREDGNAEIQIDNDIHFDQAQFRIQEFIGDS